MKKKFLSLMMAAAMVATTSVSAFAKDYKWTEDTEQNADVTITGNVADDGGHFVPGTLSVSIPTTTTYTTIDGNKKKLFTSSGIVYIKENIINFCCDSFNFPEEIDIDRAEQSLKRAQERLNNKENNNIDIERAKRAEARAKARLELK